MRTTLQLELEVKREFVSYVMARDTAMCVFQVLRAINMQNTLLRQESNNIAVGIFGLGPGVA
jgi:hypothetical protein